MKLMTLVKKFIQDLQFFLEKIDIHRDKLLFLFIKPYWPRKITPNHLTFLRIFIGLLLFVVLFYHKNNSAFLIIPLFFIGVVTDLLDGSVARGLNKETKVGAIMDPAADRILIVPIAGYSLFSSHRWLFLILILLEAANALISAYMQGKGMFMPPNIFGKIKMFLQSVVFLAILTFWPKTPNLLFIYILWVSVAFMGLSLYIKILDAKNILRQKHGKIY